MSSVQEREMHVKKVVECSLDGQQKGRMKV